MSAADHRTTAPLIPVGVWIHIEPGDGSRMAGFTYVDRDAGFSAQGPPFEGPALDWSEHVIVRLSVPNVVWRTMTADEARQLGLETPPAWVAYHGPQPERDTLWGTWRNHPKLQGLLLPDHPDDLQVIVHDGGPRVTTRAPEAVWVSVVGEQDGVFLGCVLNRPYHLQTVREGSKIQFIVPDGAVQPIMVTEKYLRERGAWRIHPCVKCGCSELFDAPSDLIRATHPNLPPDGSIEAFTTRCPLCGGAQALEPRSSAHGDATAEPSVPPRNRSPWWRFWR